MRIIKTAVLAVLFLAGQGVFAAEDTYSMVQSARRHTLEHKYKEAEALYIKALKIEPANLAIQDELVTTCNEQLSASPSSPDAHLDYGNALAYSGQLSKAQTEFKAALSLSPYHQNAEASKLMGFIDSAMRTPSASSMSAEIWIKALAQKPELVCPHCGSRAASLIPAVFGTPDPDQADQIRHGSLYQAASKVAPVDEPQWYCVNCRKQFASNGERRVDIDFGPYMADLQRRIKRAWFPPKGNESKKVVVAFTVHRLGAMNDLRIIESSQVPEADEALSKCSEECFPIQKVTNRR